jgi:hypothetical protein
MGVAKSRPSAALFLGALVLLAATACKDEGQQPAFEKKMLTGPPVPTLLPAFTINIELDKLTEQSLRSGAAKMSVRAHFRGTSNSRGLPYADEAENIDFRDDQVREVLGSGPVRFAPQNVDKRLVDFIYDGIHVDLYFEGHSKPQRFFSSPRELFYDCGWVQYLSLKSLPRVFKCSTTK